MKNTEIQEIITLIVKKTLQLQEEIKSRDEAVRQLQDLTSWLENNHQHHPQHPPDREEKHQNQRIE